MKSNHSNRRFVNEPHQSGVALGQWLPQFSSKKAHERRVPVLPSPAWSYSWAPTMGAPWQPRFFCLKQESLGVCPGNDCSSTVLLSMLGRGSIWGLESLSRVLLALCRPTLPEAASGIPRVIQPSPPPPGLSASKSGKMGQFGASEEWGKT